MKPANCIKIIFLSVVFNIGVINPSSSQKINTAGDYLDYLNSEQIKIGEDLWKYTSAVAHGKNAKRVDAKRKELINTTLNARENIAKMKDFEGDVSLRDSMISYLHLSYLILTEDYSKILNLEEIAEQSYDMMEAYMTAQDKANDKMEQAGKMVENQFKVFADKHQFKLLDSKDKLSKKLETASNVFKYYNKIYLIFFKSNKQEAYLLNALKNNDINGLEQNKTALAQFADEGTKMLDTIKPYRNDPSIKTICKQMLDFYRLEANTKIPVIIDFYMKKEKFEKTKAAFDALSPNKRTKEDVDNINKAIAEFNKALAQYNATITEIDTRRTALTNSWNNTVQSFFDRHIPNN